MLNKNTVVFITDKKRTDVADLIKKEFNSDFLVDFSDAIKKNSKYLDISEQNIKIKDEYLYVQNSILVDFISF